MDKFQLVPIKTKYDHKVKSDHWKGEQRDLNQQDIWMKSDMRTTRKKTFNEKT